MKFLAALLAVSAFAADIPRTWEQAKVDSLEVPLAMRAYSPVHLTEAAYYRIAERVIYKSYPVYAAGREPAGYQEFLKSVEPAVAFDAITLKSPEDWIAAGEMVFNAPTSFGMLFFSAQNVRDVEWMKRSGMPVAKDGTVPFARWVVRKKGAVELGSMGCATCHTRVLPDGTVIPGAPGNNPNDRQGAMLMRASAAVVGPDRILTQVRRFAEQFELPWRSEDPNRRARSMTLNELMTAGEAIPPGVSARANTSMLLPPQIPDLIGVRDRRYLDHTGLIRHREIGDLMRYSSLAQDLFTADRYGDGDAPPAPGVRYSDAQLFALASYLYALEPPPNPNRWDASTERGKRLFVQEQCVDCHTPPLYTNNKLVPVEGFDATGGIEDVLPVRIGLDPQYTLETRKGTGYYKVPSLKGLWYRGPFGHQGAAATLEEWLDPARLAAGYVPAGYKGYDGKARSIPGHPFGLRLTAAQRGDLVRFLKTL